MVQDLVQRKVRLLDLHAAGLDLGQVEDVVDDGQQMVGRGIDLAQALALPIGQRSTVAAGGSAR